MSQGWIKLHRQFQEKGYANKPAYVALWVHLLLMANHREKEFMWNGRIIKLQPGQFVTGRKALSEVSGVPQTTVERALDFFENERQIGQQKTSKYRLVTILNWDKHQIVDNKWTTGGQLADTNKNEKNKKKIISANAQTDMSFKKYGDDYEEGVVDLESGELHDPSKEAAEQDRKLNQRKRELVDWLIKIQNRDPLRTNRPKQLKALNRLIEMQVTGKEAQDIILDQMRNPFWEGKKEKPDFSTVVAIIEKRGE